MKNFRLFGILMTAFGVFYLYYSIMFRTKITYYFRKINVVEGKEENFLKIQLYFSIFNSFIAIVAGIYTIMYNPNPPLTLLVPGIIHFLNHIAKERSRVDGYIE